MSLERIFTHRLIRVLRVVVPILVVVLVAIPAWNYVSKRGQQQKTPPRQAQTLAKELAVLTEGFTFSRTEGGRTLFTIRAKTNLGFKDNKGMLEDVDVTVFGANENEPTRRIRSKSCSYDQPSGGEVGDIRFTGDVEVQLDEKTFGHTEELIYSYRDRIVTTSQKATLEQPGIVKTETNGLQYELKTGLLKLASGVKVQGANDTALEAGSAVFHQEENWAAVDGGVFMQSATGWIRGAKGNADLEPGTFKPRKIVIETDIAAESRPKDGKDSWKLRAGWLETIVSAAGVVEHVKARGNVEVEKQTRDAKQILTGGEINASLDSSGKVTMLEAHDNARMVFGADRTLRSDQIFTNASGLVQTTENSRLEMGNSVIEGRQFSIQDGDLISFTTSYRANLQMSDRRSSADRTEARVDSRTNTLVGLTQTGNFQFQEGSRQIRARSARFEDSGNVVFLDGAPVVSDSQMRLEAAQIRLDQKDNSFTAAKNVKTITKNSGEPVLVTAASAQGNADAFVYTDNVQLWRGNAYIKSDRLEVSTMDNSLKAEGHVQSTLEAIRAVSDKLEYNDGDRLAHYSGNIRAQKQDMILETRDMTVKRGEKDVSEIVAAGGVTVTQGGQRGTGDKAIYNAAGQNVTLTGKPAQIVDRQRGSTQGSRLVMDTSGKKVTVEGGESPAVTKRQIKK